MLPHGTVGVRSHNGSGGTRACTGPCGGSSGSSPPVGHVGVAQPNYVSILTEGLSQNFLFLPLWVWIAIIAGIAIGLLLVLR